MLMFIFIHTYSHLRYFRIKRKIKEKELHYKYEISFKKRKVCSGQKSKSFRVGHYHSEIELIEGGNKFI